MAIDDGKDITRAPLRKARLLREELAEWVESACGTLSRATRGEAVRVGRPQIAAAGRVALILQELAELWRHAPPRGLRDKARKLNKKGAVGFPSEPSGLEAVAGAVAAVLWAAQITRKNRRVPEQLSRALQRTITGNKARVPKAQAEAFLALLWRSLDRRNLAESRAQALHEVTHLPLSGPVRNPPGRLAAEQPEQRALFSAAGSHGAASDFGPWPVLTPAQRLWLVTLAKLLKEDPEIVCHKSIGKAAGKSTWWSTKMPPHLEKAGLIPERPARGRVVWAITAKGRAWIAHHEPTLT